MRSPWAGLPFAALLALLVGCTSPPVRVTGQDPESSTWAGAQSETSVAVAHFGGGTVITVAYNGDDPSTNKIQYTSATRTVFPGASLMGWSFSLDRGKTWKSGGLVTVSGTDPLNLAGIVLPGPRVPAIYSNRVMYRDGVAVAALIAGDVQYFESVDQEKAWAMRNMLLRTPVPEELAKLM